MIGIILGADYQPIIMDGTLQLGEITPQNQALLIQCHKGEFKENPALGVGISDMTLDHDPLAWKGRIRETLELDGQTVEEVKVSRIGISIRANYI